MDVTGSVSVEDGSGSLRIRSVSGDVVITDVSGSIEVRAVGGPFGSTAVVQGVSRFATWMGTWW